MDIGNIGQDVQPLRRAPGVRLHRAAGMAGAALVLMLVFNAANLPSPLYVIYRQRLHFSEIMLALIFAAVSVFGGASLAQLLNPQLADFVFALVLCGLAIAAAAMGTIFGTRTND